MDLAGQPAPHHAPRLQGGGRSGSLCAVHPSSSLSRLPSNFLGVALTAYLVLPTSTLRADFPQWLFSLQTEDHCRPDLGRGPSEQGARVSTTPAGQLLGLLVPKEHGMATRQNHPCFPEHSFLQQSMTIFKQKELNRQDVSCPLQSLLIHLRAWGRQCAPSLPPWNRRWTLPPTLDLATADFWIYLCNLGITIFKWSLESEFMLMNYSTSKTKAFCWLGPQTSSNLELLNHR